MLGLGLSVRAGVRAIECFLEYFVRFHALLHWPIPLGITSGEVIPEATNAQLARSR